MEGKMQPPAGPGGRKRQNLTLDLNSASAKRNKVQSLLTSPDVQKLMLTSPDLEKFLSQNPSLATPTPTGYPFPRSVTEEQMMYAKGFEEALEHLRNAEYTSTATETHHGSMAAAAQLSEASMVAAATTLACLSSAAVNHSQFQPHHHQLISGPAAGAALPHLPENLSVQPVTVPHPAAAAPLPLSVPGASGSLHIHLTDPHSRPNSGASGSYDSESVNIKDEPDDQSLSGGEYSSITSPDGSGGHRTHVSPIDMDDQERIKLERKRMRNRVAASKCRKRKLEKISLLDDRVQQLKTENADLAAVVKKMKASVAILKQEVIEHVNSGCEIRMTDTASIS
jgi:hypothetical protein